MRKKIGLKNGVFVWVSWLIFFSIIGCQKEQIDPSDKREEIFFKLYGGPDNYQAVDIHEVLVNGSAEDGFIILANRTTSIGIGDTSLYVVRINNEGNEVWSKFYSEDKNRVSHSMAIIPGEGFLIAGMEVYKQDSTDIFLLRLDNEGNVVWDRNLGINQGQARQVLWLENGHFLVTGTSVERRKPVGLDQNILLVNVNEDGDLFWKRSYGFPSFDIGVSLTQGPNNDYYLTGTSSEFKLPNQGNSNIVLIHVNNQGQLLEAKSFGTLEGNFANKIQVYNRELILLGTTVLPERNSREILLQKVNQQFNVIWYSKFSVPDNTLLEGNELQLDDSEELLVTGSSNSLKDAQEGTDLDYYLSKVDMEGNLLWERNYGSIGDDMAEKAIFSKDGNILLLGTSDFGNNKMISLLKVNPNGKLN